MKWIGQHIYDLVSRFRDDVYLEDLSTTTETSVLVVDSDGKVSKSTSVAGDLTAIVAGTGLSGSSLSGPIPTLNVDASQTQITGVGTIGTGVWNGTAITTAYIAAAQTNITSLGTLTTLTVDNIGINGHTITASDDLAIVVHGNDVTVDTDNFTIESATSQKPSLTISSTSANNKAGNLVFHKDRDAAAVANDDIGLISFTGVNDAEEAQTYAYINGSISSEVDGDEAGKLVLAVAKNAGFPTIGLTLEGEHDADEIDVTIASGVASTTTVAGNLTVTSDLTANGDTHYFTSANSADPLVIIKNTTDDEYGGRLRFLNARGADGQDDDEAGKIEFFSYDDGTPSGEEYATIKATIHDATATEESGKLQLQVASHDGGTEDGLVLTGGSVNAEVDVTIGNGTASVTTVAGDLVVTGSDLTFDSVALTAVQTSGESFADNDTSIMTSAAIDDAIVKGGSNNIIKVLPHHFMSNEDGGANKSAQFRDDTIIGVRATADNAELYAFVEIPFGKTATSVIVYGNDTGNVVNVYESDISAGALTDKTPGGGCVVGTICDITDVAADVTNYLVIKVTITSYTNDIVYGASVIISG